MVPVREDLEHVKIGEGDTVPNGLNPRDKLLYVQECGRIGPTEYLRPPHGPRMPLQRAPEVIHQVPWAAYPRPPPAPNHLDEGGQTLHGPTEVNTKTKGTEGQE